MWREAQRRALDRHWPAVERLLDGLPPRLFRQAKLLEYDLAMRWSTSGQFRDIFLGVEHFPLTSIGPWLLEDRGARRGPDRDEAESHLVVAGVLLAARTHLAEAILDPASFVDREHIALIEALSERSMRELAGVVPAASPFWAARDIIAEDDLDARLEAAERRRGPATADDPMGYLRPAWSAAARVLAMAATEFEPPGSTHPIARPAVDADVAVTLDALAEAAQIRDDLATMQRDLQDGRPSFPIAATALAADVPLDPWPSPAVMLGAMIATGSLERVLDEAVRRLHVSRDAAVRARLPTFAAYLGDVIADLEERRADGAMGMARPAAARRRSEATTAVDDISAGMAPAPAVAAPARPRTPLVPAAEPTVPRAIAMAEGFLFADRTYRESWEMHREGMFGAAAVWSRFPEGLILEILAAHGHDMTAEVEDLRSFTVANGFRYFAHPWSGVDSDTVGVFLRLLPLAAPQAAHREALERVLGRLDAQVRATGAVPVWIAGDGQETADRPPTVDLGEGCGTVAAHLLLGLLSDDAPAHEGTVMRGAAHLLGRIADVGLGANVDYPPLYALARFEQLIARLSDARAKAVAELAGPVTAARIALASARDRAIARGPRSAQDAALLTLACLHGGRDDRLDPAWQATILKRQRFDGGWSGEPFAAAPNRGRSVTWYSSATLTSALCYDALRRASPGGGSGLPSDRRLRADAARPTSVA